MKWYGILAFIFLMLILLAIVYLGANTEMVFATKVSIQDVKAELILNKFQ